MALGGIGDAHLGLKAYDSTRRTLEGMQTFGSAVEILYAEGVRHIVIPGDFLDDTNLPNWAQKILLSILTKYDDVTFVLLGGNHDTTKTYSSVSALDVLHEVSNVMVVNNFEAVDVTTGEYSLLMIPHMKSQKEFIAAVDRIITEGKNYDLITMHCMVNSTLDLGPNDLNIDQARLNALQGQAKAVWLGHQHQPAQHGERAFMLGSTMEFTFGELGARYVYVLEESTRKIPLPQPRQLCERSLPWTDLIALAELTSDLDPEVIYKFVITSIPQEAYSQVAMIMANAKEMFSGDMIYDMLRAGRTELKVSAIEASFDLMEEYAAFCKENDIDDPEAAILLEECVNLVAAEEEDMILC